MNLVNSDSRHTESVVDTIRFAALRSHFGLLGSHELPGLAMMALEAGLDSQAIRELAGERNPTWSDSGDLFVRLLQDLDINIPSWQEAPHALALHYAEQILSGGVTPFVGAHEIWMHVANYFFDDAEQWQRYEMFVGLAVDWQDDVTGRQDCERRIRDAAARLLDLSISS